MGLAIELYFDDVAERAIRALRQTLADNGVPSLLDALGDRPHISLAGLPDEDVAPIRLLVEALASLTPLSLRLEAVGFFPSAEGVVFLAPTPTQPLLNAHQRLHAALGAAGVATNPYYLPGRWIPHCTVAPDLSPNDLVRALAVCQQAFTPIALTCGEIGIIRFRPVVPIVAYRFTG